MELTLFGLNHNSAPVDVRERWAHSQQDSQQRLASLSRKLSPAEHVILSTCNRTEFYSRLPRARSPLSGKLSSSDQRLAMANFYLGGGRFHPEDVEHFYLHREEAAVEHLFRLAGGLGSMIIGECEILRQIKEAYSLSQQSKTAGVVFRRLFPAALKVGKQVRTLTKISEGCISPGQAALKLARETLGNLGESSVLLIGSGKIGALAARAVLEAGISNFDVVNRTPQRAYDLLEKLNVEESLRGRVSECFNVVEWDRLPEALERADFVIASTGSTLPIVDRPEAERIQEARGHRPYVVVDLAVPRDFSADCREVPGVHLHNIDSLNRVIQENIQQRSAHIPKAESIIREQLQAFMGRLVYLKVDPIIKHMVERFEEIRLGELQSAVDKFPPEHHKDLQRLTRSLMNKLLDFPISRLKSIRNMGGLNETEVGFLKRLFLTETHGDGDGPDEQAGEQRRCPFGHGS